MQLSPFFKWSQTLMKAAKLSEPLHHISKPNPGGSIEIQETRQQFLENFRLMQEERAKLVIAQEQLKSFE